MLVQSILLLFSSLLLIAAWKDLTEYKIPNAISVALVVMWPFAAFVFGLGWTASIMSILVALCVLTLCIVLWLPGWIGGGDGKLLAVVALWFGWPDVVSFLLYTILAGGVLSVSLIALRKLAPSIGLAGKPLQGTVLEEGGSSPYGIAIAAGALLSLPSSQLLIASAS